MCIRDSPFLARFRNCPEYQDVMLGEDARLTIAFCAGRRFDPLAELVFPLSERADTNAQPLRYFYPRQSQFFVHLLPLVADYCQ